MAYGDVGAAINGMQADSGISHNESGWVAGEEILFGKPVYSSTAESGVAVNIDSANKDSLIGISLQIDNGKGKYEVNDTLTIKRVGRMWVEVDGIVKYGQTAYYDETLKKFTGDNAKTAISTAVFKTENIDGLAIVEINLP